MISAVYDTGALYGALDIGADIYTEKIRSYADAYGTGYPFCRFFVGGGAVICSYYSDHVIAMTGEISDEDASELAEFLACACRGRVLMRYSLCERLGLLEKAEKLCLMQWDNSVKKSVDYNKEGIETDTPLGKVYEIAASGFDIDFDKWYTDISHSVRHGIARTYSLDNAACAVRMFSSRGITYLSYICTRPERRGEGLAKRLLRAVCGEEASVGNRVYVFCEDGLEGFYKSAGFIRYGTAAHINLTETGDGMRK